MTLQQLEYIVALDKHGQFSTAAESCYVSQPSLSALIKKLEEELGVTLFDRRKQPIVPTETGMEVIAQARVVLHEAEMLRQMVNNRQEVLSGSLKVGIIPTIAPYLLPLFLESFSEKHPQIRLEIIENTTGNIQQMLRKGMVDACVLATPVLENNLISRLLYEEAFVVYAPHESAILEKQYLLAEDIDPEKVILMEEGHCIRDQVINLCQIRHAQSRMNNIYFEAGNLETARRLVEAHSGITILPQLAMFDLDEERVQHVRFFKDPAPVREVVLVTNKKCPKRRLTGALADCILANIPQNFR